MRANLKAKRNVSNDMSRTSSNKTGDSSIEDARKTPSPLPPRSSTDSSHSNKAQPLVSNDGRSGSFTSYTPLPKFPETRRPSVPSISTQGIPYGRPSRPTIDTGVRSGSFSSSPVEYGQGRRGSGSDAKRPIIDTRGGGNRSASNSPVIGSMPFSNQSGRSRASSRSRTMDQAIIGNLPLPVFAPREGLPEIRGPTERSGRSQSPAGRTSPGRPQSPGRGVSPGRGLPPPRSQSPARGNSPGQNTQQGRESGRVLGNRTPSPLKDVSAEKGENLTPELGRTPSPAKDTAMQREGGHRTVSIEIPTPPAKDGPISTEPAPIAIPNPAELVSKDITSKTTLPPTPVPPPVNQSQSTQPLSPQPQKNVALQYTLPSVNLPAPSQEDINRTITPSSDAEKTNEDDRQGNLNVPPEKRITVFLQEAGKRKESQELPPLPSEPAPPLPPPHATALALAESQKAAPVQRLEKYVQREPPSPLIPPPSAPILASKLTQSERGDDSDSLDDSPPSSPLTRSKVNEAPLPQTATTVAIPSTSHMTPLSSEQDHKPHIPHPSASIPPPVPQPRTPTTPVTGRDAASPSGLRLPELDALRPITWGPLAFGETPHQTPEKSTHTSPAHQTPLKSVMEPLDNVDEESDWEKDDEEIDEENAAQANEGNPQQEDESYNREQEEMKTDASENVPDLQREEAVQNRYDPEESAGLPRVVEEVNPGPGYSSADEEHISKPRVDKGKGKEIYSGETPTSSQPTSPQTFNYPEPVPRSKFIDRDITSFFASNVFISADSPRSQTPKQTLPPLQTQPVPAPPTTQPLPLNYLPHFMLGKDIPELSTVAQRVGAYQSRREQMARTDTGLRGWLLQIQQTQPLNLSLRTSSPVRLMIVERPPNIKRLSKDSYGTAPSPIIGSLPFAGGSHVTRKMISKMKIGGKKISAATKNTMKLGSSTGDRGSYDEMDYARRSNEARRTSPREPLASSPASQRASVESPAVSRSEFSPQAEFQENTYRDPEPGTSGSGQQEYYGYPNERQPLGLGLTAPHEPYATEGPSQSTSSFPNYTRTEPQHQPSVPYSQPAGTNVSKKEGGRHGFSASISGGKASKLFGGFSNEPKTKHHSDSAEYSPPQPQSSSPKQKSKFSKFVNDLSHSTITGGKHSHSGSQSRIVSSPTRPPPPDKSQFRVTSEGSSSKVKGFFADLGSRDITGARVSDKQTSPRQQSTIPVSSEDRTSGVGSAGFGRIFADLNKRNITGATEQERLEAARRREQESTHLPAQPMVYDETASDWEVKLEQMEDVLPHIRREMLADALKQAGGDEQRAIGLAVINSR